MHMAPDYMFVEEIAAVARVPRRSVYWWIATGKLPSVRPGRRRLVRRPDFDAFMRRAAR